MKRWPFTAVFFLLILTGGFGEESLRIKRTVFVPPRFYVGDTVDLLVFTEKVREQGFSGPEALPEDPWITISRVEVKQLSDGLEIRIRLTPFRPGKYELPEIQFGGYTLKGIRIPTGSLTDGTGESFRGPKGPLLLPGSRLYLVVLSIGVLMVFGLLYFFFKKGPGIFYRIFGKQRKRAAGRRFLKVLGELESASGTIDPAAFYTRLNEGMRSCFSVLFSVDYQVLTTTEIEQLQDEFSGLVPVLRRGDRVRFGVQDAAADEMKEDVLLVRSTLLLFRGKKGDTVKKP